MAVNSTTIASITFDSTLMDAVGSVSVSSSRPPIEVTQMGSANSYFVAGIATSVIALDIYYNKADHQKFVDKLQNGTASAFTIEVAEGVESSSISGSAYVIGCDVVAALGDIVRGSVALQVNGILTHSGTAAVSGGNET